MIAITFVAGLLPVLGNLISNTVIVIVGVIDGFRWCLLGGQAQIYWPGFAISLGVIAFFLWLGIHTFRATEKTFADMF